ncbi:hypothetical protein GXW83_18615 [Streptacidiphilus sp. PB12-B1b]|uniref:non-homologous end-joining DNA ligase n=1 Tax=Streptacidiphilus sp. PB12-B1b TaxID=2705012 RepID=UPI0015FA94AC|nr:non-homologous end-joining DNA ligase [Streptacidiphilus sp. PB12-B1b]QMU77410.1 hypothetical protein GXW83_18615 [Streptacidiphilus sp. PB12-B1b]
MAADLRASTPAPTGLPALHPMLASTGPMPGTPADWAFEVKWDGMRVLCYLDGAGGLRLQSRAGNDATARYPELESLVGLLPQDAVLDGEVIAADAHGRPSFSRLQQRMTLRSPIQIKTASVSVPVTLLVFDVLWLGGTATTDLAYTGRRHLLEALELHGDHVLVPPAWPGEAVEEARQWTREHGLEGMIAKRLDSPYRPGKRTRDWVKLKNVRTADVFVGAWVPADARATSVKALLVGIAGAGGLRYAGAVGTGFSQAERTALAEVLRRLDSRTAPFADGIAGIDRGEPVRFVRPVLHGEVEFLETTVHGHLRQPVWKGLRGARQDEPPPYGPS